MMLSWNSEPECEIEDFANQNSCFNVEILLHHGVSFAVEEG
jgi:hypothetical protein